MRIAFIYPATEFDHRFHAEALPIGMLYLAASAEKVYGAKVDLYDSRHGGELPDATALAGYDLVGFTSMSMQVTRALSLAQTVRDRGYRGPLVFGGPHASVATEHLKEQPFIDAVFVGEAEDTFLQYLAHLEGKPHKLERVWTRLADRSWEYHGGDCFIRDLDSLPFPAREKYGDLSRRMGFINMTTTRGCPFECNYCQPTKKLLFGQKVRRRSVGNIVAEITDAVGRFGIHRFSIDDDTFTFHKKTVLELCEQVRPLGLAWSCQSRSDIDRETLAAMRDSGCDMIFVGAESGSQRMLDLMDKRNKVENNAAFIRACNELGIQTWCNIMVGYPGETRRDMEMSLDFVAAARPSRVCVSQVTPFPGTHLWDRHRDDVVHTDWDSVARHVRRAKFHSMAPMQNTVELYIELMNKELEMPMGVDLLGPSPLKQFLGRRSLAAFKLFTRKWGDYLPALHGALADARAGRTGEAVRTLDSLSRRFPRMAAPLGNLGWICLTTGRPAQAADAYRRLVDLEPNNAEAHYLWGRALAETADTAGAERAWREALRIDPGHRGAAEALGQVRAA